MLRRILKNIGALTIATVLSRLLSFYINIYLARTLGPNGLGQVSLAQAIIIYFSLITDLGLKTYATNQIAGRLAQSRTLLNRIFSLRILLGIISFLICLFMVHFFPFNGETKSLIVRMSLLIIIAGATIDWVFYLKEEMQWNSLVEIIQNVVLVSLIYIMIKNPEDILLVPISYVVGSFCALTASVALLKYRYRIPRFDINYKAFFAIFKQALPIGLSIVIITLQLNLPQIMLGFMRGSREIGLYAAAYKFSNLGVLGLGIFLGAVYPTLVQLFRNRPEVYFMGIKLASRFLLLVGLALGVFVSLLSDHFIIFFYGSEFAETGRVFGLLIWSLAIMTMRLFYDNYYLVAGKQKLYLKLAIVYFFTCLLMNVILIQIRGIYGAAAAVVIADLTFAICQLIFLPRNSFKNYYLPFAGVLLTGSLMYVLQFLGIHRGMILMGFLVSFAGWAAYIVKNDYMKWVQLKLILRSVTQNAFLANQTVDHKPRQ